MNWLITNHNKGAKLRPEKESSFTQLLWGFWLIENIAKKP